MKICLFLGLILSFNLASEEIALLGLDDNNREIEFKINKNKYKKVISKYVNDLSYTTINMLESNNQKMPWVLTEIEVGIYISSSIGIGPIWKIGYGAGSRIVFGRKK